jgi:hypothetical protein|tara:strand:- start:10207 stop:11037 length:831 start_codon:yes stop_codon:yes gene_type:complete
MPEYHTQDSDCNCPCKRAGHPWCLDSPSIHTSTSIVDAEQYRGSGTIGVYDRIKVNIGPICLHKCPVDETNMEDQYACVVNGGITPYSVLDPFNPFENCGVNLDSFMNYTGYIAGVTLTPHGPDGGDVDCRWYGSAEFIVRDVPTCSGVPFEVTYKVALQVNCTSGNISSGWRPIIDKDLRGILSGPDHPCVQTTTKLIPIRGDSKPSTMPLPDDATDTNGVRTLHDLLEEQDESYRGRVFLPAESPLDILSDYILSGSEALPSGDTPWSPPLGGG